MSKEMLINTVEGQECRIAIIHGRSLEELYIERVSNASHVGNIYKGRVTNVEPSIQAAFIDFGLGKNGFLHISDVHPQYFPRGRSDSEAVGRKRSRRDRPPIQECLRRGQEVVVQMTKEGIGTKGPTMTTYLSIPGRLLVMMPGMTRLGVSRKIEDEESRLKARELLSGLKLPDDCGFIVRTAGLERGKREFQRDLNYLDSLWKAIEKRIKNSKAPAEIYQESDLVIRTIRDVYNSDIDRIVCDNVNVAKKIQDFLDIVMPRSRHSIDIYVGKEGLFHEYGIEDDIEQIYSRRVELSSGGSIVIDQTEALVAIDVNSGRFRSQSNAEATALKINIEAAKEIARQLRLRDLGGVVIIDFIDMREDKNRREVEKALRDAIKPDRAKSKILRISSFGIVEMTRQRMRPSLKDSISRICPYCRGSGRIKSDESQSLLVFRNLQQAVANENVASVEMSVTPSVAHHLLNYQRHHIADIELKHGKKIIIRADDKLAGDEMTIKCFNSRGSEVAWESITKDSKEGHKVETVPLGDAPLDEVPASVAVITAPPIGPDGQPIKKSRRRGRRGGRKHKKHFDAAGTAAPEAAGAPAAEPIAAGQQPQPQPQPSQQQAQSQPQPQQPQQQQQSQPGQGGGGTPQEGVKKSRRRGRRGGRKHKKHFAEAQRPADGIEKPAETAAAETDPSVTVATAAEPAAPVTENVAPQTESSAAADQPAAKKPRRRRSRKAPADQQPAPPPAENQ